MTELSTTLLEKFVTCANKADVLKEVPPHSPLFRFIELIIAFNDPTADRAALEKNVKHFVGSGAKSGHKEYVQLRMLLDQLSAAKGNPEEVKRLAGELNRKYLHYEFDAVNPFQTEFRSDLHRTDGGAPTSTLSESDRRSLTLEAALEKVYEDADWSHLNLKYLKHVDLKRLDFSQHFDLVTTILLNTPRVSSMANVVAFLQKLMEQSRGVDFVHLQLWSKLSLQNKEALLAKNTPLGHKPELWIDLVNHKFDLQRLASTTENVGELIPDLEKVSEFVKKMPAKFVHFRRVIHLKLLDEKVKLGIADKKTLLEYLKDPVADDTVVINQHFSNQLLQQRQGNKEHLQALPFFSLQEGGIVRKALLQVLRGAGDYKDFEDYVDPRVLAKIFYEQKLLNGEEAADAKDHLTEEEMQKLFAEKRLRFLETNKRCFGKEEKVEVGVEVKNISRLTVRQFEVNTLSYLLDKGDEVFEQIDTSGLIPLSEQEYRYSQSAMVVHRENFEFQSIRDVKKGVYIIDFIGGDVKTRAVIIKGQLTLAYCKAGGRTAVLLDQDGNVCKGDRTGVYIKGTFFPARGSDGQIRIPGSVGADEWKVVAVHDGFATLCQLQLKDPNPVLKLNVLYNSETFQPGNTVVFVLEPKLELFGRTADPSLLQKVCVRVATTNEQGVSNSTSFPGLQVNRDSDLTVSLIFPPKVRAVNVEMSAAYGEDEQDKTLTVTRTLIISSDSQDNVQSFLVQKHAGANLRFSVVGRNGEPRRNQVVNVMVGLKFLNNAKTFTLVSDEHGNIELDAIKDISFVEVTSGAALAVYNPTEDLQIAYPDTVDLKEGEEFTLPFNAPIDAVCFTQVRNDAIVREFAPNELKRDGCTLTLPALQEGTYHLEADERRVVFRVHKGEYLDGKRLLKTRDSVIALGERFSWFQSKRENADAWEVRLWAKNPSVKARLLTFNYLPTELKELSDDASAWQGSEHLSDALQYAARAPSNAYGGQIFVGDEAAYVYARSCRKSFIGNTLEKPGVLLKRNRVAETEEVEQMVRQAQAMDRLMDECEERYSLQECCSKQACSRRSCYPRGSCGRMPGFVPGQIALREYLANPGKMVVGLKPENGVLKIPKTLTAPYPFSFLSVSDGYFSAIIPLCHDARRAETKDITLRSSRREGFVYAYSRDVKVASPSQPMIVPNVQNTQVCILASLKEFWSALLTLSPSLRSQAEEWDFLTAWGTLDPMEKLKKYDKYACHELNLFVFNKDPEFFEGVVLPHIRNKREKGIVDHYLLSDFAAVADRVKLAASEPCPLIEKILLAALSKSTCPAFGESLLQYVKSYLSVNKLPMEERKRRFETLMNVNAEGHPTFEADNAEDRDGYVAVGAMQSFNVCMAMAAPAPAPVPPPHPGSMNRFRAAAAPRMKPRKANVKQEWDFCDEDESEEGSEKQEIFKPAQKTVEYNERQYYEAPPANRSPSEFFSDLLQHLVRNPDARGFASSQFLSGIDSLHEFLLALAFTELPFEKTTVSSFVEGTTLTLTAPTKYVLLVKEVIEKPGERADIEVQCSQKIYDPADPVIYDDEDPEVFYDKPVDEFVAGRPYASRVVVTNSTTTQVKLSLIMEVPEGSIPLDSADVLRIRDLVVQPFNSAVVEFRFYFPRVGKFDMFPATVVKGNHIVASARHTAPIHVRLEKSSKGMKTICDVLANGNIADIIEFMKSKNLLNPNVFALHQIYWLLKNRDFYNQAVALCEEKGMFDETLWSYSVFHGDYGRLKELLQNRTASDDFFPVLAYHSGDVLHLDRFKVREYYPLINPRAHVLGNAPTNIANTTFKKTYEEYLNYLLQKFTPTVDDLVLLVNYLIAQDQIEKALELTARISGREGEVLSRIQLEYQTAYLNFITGYPDFSKAKAICERYLTYPVLFWRNLFVEMANQLAEFEEADFLYKIDPKHEGESLNKKKAAQAASFSASLDGKKVKLVSSQVGEVTLRFYKVELEVVFSAKPFEFQIQKEFTFVSPFRSLTVAVNDADDLAVSFVDLPPEVLSESMFIEARASSNKLRKSEYLTYLPFDLNCIVTKEFGILKVLDPHTNKPVPRIYAKCFAKYTDGSVRFYKDGYTDIRGSFDYVSLNTDKIDNIQSFAILVTSPEHGSKVIVEEPPAKIGTAEGQAKKLVSEGWAQKRELCVQKQKTAKANQYLSLY